MTTYLLRRILYMIPILLGINIITFALFFMVNSPDDMARMQLGEKHVSKAAIEHWKKERGYDLPLFYNDKQAGLNALTETLFYQKSFRLFLFDFGVSDAGRDISYDISHRMWPSLAIAIPVLIFGLFINIVFAMLMAFFRSSYLDLSGVVFCIILMSISTMFYIIGGQYLFGKVLRLVPISGYDDGLNSIKFVALPILVAVMSGIGAGSRWYRTLFLEEMHRDYVKTARAKGLSEIRVLFRHVLKNAMLPILTGIVVIIPSLFMGSLVLESFFGIPGLGSYIIDAIQQQDFAIVRAMVFLGSVLYIVGLILTDISYTLVDPRVRLR
ncbi:ABC transporter permease [Legionella impletisoli]|uniref:Peptide ABC transporter permease n=1 Tax=Legionella impletisoli TaxID=343510 RepID=A0A917JQQ8_9GAMM|nr:ABC transporter permease [Legionella impletisoli]GGI78929.1 peptide ABC transporter permease [Legionella impletisoli]